MKEQPQDFAHLSDLDPGVALFALVQQDPRYTVLVQALLAVDWMAALRWPTPRW